MKRPAKVNGNLNLRTIIFERKCDVWGSIIIVGHVWAKKFGKNTQLKLQIINKIRAPVTALVLPVFTGTFCILFIYAFCYKDTNIGRKPWINFLLSFNNPGGVPVQGRGLKHELSIVCKPKNCRTISFRLLKKSRDISTKTWVATRWSHSTQHQETQLV